MMKKVVVTVEYAEKNLSAYIEGVPIVVVGDNLAEIKDNTVEAIDLYLKSTTKPVAALSGNYELTFQFDPQRVFSTADALI